MKRCPLIKELIATDTGPREVQAECLETACSWYVENRCAVNIIAKALYSMDEFGIRKVSHD